MRAGTRRNAPERARAHVQFRRINLPFCLFYETCQMIFKPFNVIGKLLRFISQVALVQIYALDTLDHV